MHSASGPYVLIPRIVRSMPGEARHHVRVDEAAGARSSSSESGVGMAASERAHDRRRLGSSADTRPAPLRARGASRGMAGRMLPFHSEGVAVDVPGAPAAPTGLGGGRGGQAGGRVRSGCVLGLLRAGRGRVARGRWRGDRGSFRGRFGRAARGPRGGGRGGPPGARRQVGKRRHPLVSRRRPEPAWLLVLNAMRMSMRGVDP